MHVFVSVTVQNLVQTLFRGDLDCVVVLGERIDDANKASALRQIADAVACLVLPPGHGEVRLPFRARVDGRHVQESTLRAHVFNSTGLWVHVSAWLNKRDAS